MDPDRLERFKADLRPLLADYDAVRSELIRIDEALMVTGDPDGSLLAQRATLSDTLEAIGTLIIDCVGQWLEEG